MVDFRIDRFKYNWRGAWTDATEFIRDDVVSYNGSSYVCIKSHTASSLFNNDLIHRDTTNNIPDPYWVKMTEGSVWKDQWKPDTVYDPGDVVAYSGVLYLCVVTHVSSVIFDDTVQNWTVYSSQISFRQDWIEATRYGIGDVVRYGGTVYRCAQGHESADTNLGLETDQEKWTIVNSGFEYTGDWELDKRYRVGDLVKFGSSVFRCKQEHTPLDESTINFDLANYWELMFPGYQFVGNWDILTTYKIGDVVSHGGWLFYSITNNVSSNPVTSIYQLEDKSEPVDWEILSKGTNFRGDWNIGQSYKVGDVVRRGGNLYVAILDTEITADGSSLDYLDSSNWELIVQSSNFTEAWDENIEFSVGDIVTFFGTAWICQLEHLSTRFNFPSLDVPSEGTGFLFWKILAERGSEAGLQFRGDLLSYGFSRETIYSSDDSSLGLRNIEIAELSEQLLTIDNTDRIIYKSYGLTNRIFYVAPSGTDDLTRPLRGKDLSLPWKTIKFACEQADDGFEGTTTINVSTGRYDEVLPISVPARTAVVGDELRSTTITASLPVISLENDSEYTIAALQRIIQIIQATVEGRPLIDIEKMDSNLLDPVVLNIAVDPAATAAMQISIVDMQNYINFHINQIGTDPTIIGNNTPITALGVVNAVTSLIANKEFLARDAIEFVKLEYPLYNFEEDLFRENLFRFMDALTYDVIYAGNYKSILSARHYKNLVVGSQLEDMFYLRDTTGLRNCTLSGLSGVLQEPGTTLYRLPTAGAYCSLDPGWGPDDTRTWIIKRSPYVQNVTTLGTACVGQKIDGALHNGGNRSITSNDFTQVISDGIGAWVTNQGRAELVSVFSYYAQVGYLTTNGGIIRGTNGNNSYGTYGSFADGSDPREIPQNATVNNRQQEATATVFAGDFTDAIQVIEWSHAGEQYSQVTATFVGAGVGASTAFEDFRDDAVFNCVILDTSDTEVQRIGGGGYVRAQNNAQINSGDSLTSIVIASNDPNTEETYLGCRIILTSGPGTGQYGYITAYNEATKLVSVSRESNNEPGWDHVIPGTLPTVPLTTSTSYRIEPRVTFSAPEYITEARFIPVSTNWGSIVYGETTDIFEDVVGTPGTGIVIEDDGLTPTPASFKVTKTGRIYSVETIDLGLGYQTGDTIVITGNVLGGITPYNDLIITVTATGEDSSNSIEDITASGIGASGKFVALAESGSAGIYSSNGLSWDNAFTMPSSDGWINLAAGNNRFVAVKTNSNQAAYSLNGSTWLTASMPADRSWKSIVFGNNRFVAIASDQNSAAYSSNGESWITSSLPTLGDSTINEWVSITYGAGNYVAVANSQNVAAYSSDGISWTGVIMSVGKARNWIGIAYGDNRYVALSSTGNILYSFDKETWIETNLPATTLKWNKIKYSQGVFVAIAFEQTDNSPSNLIATSQDGAVWEIRILSSTSRWKDLAFGNPYVPAIDAEIGTNTPMWVAISNSNIINQINVGARALGKAEVSAGIVREIKLWNPGSGYRNEPTVTLISPTVTSDASIKARVGDGVIGSASWLNRGFGYRSRTTTVSIQGNGFADTIPLGKFVILSNLDRLPGPGTQLKFENNDNLYTLATIEQQGFNGKFTAVVRVTPELKVRDYLEHNTGVLIREKYSQIRITGHDFLDIGTGNFEQTNYPDIYTGAFFSSEENEVEERNGGRVFYTATDQSGNFKVGELFLVEQSTGIVTLSSDFFQLGGLDELRLGGIRLGGSGAVIREFSTDPTMTEDSNNVVPTQRAIAAFLANRLSLGGSEIAVFRIQAGQILLGGIDIIRNSLGNKTIVRSRADFVGANSGVSGSIVAQNLFYKSFNE